MRDKIKLEKKVICTIKYFSFQLNIHNKDNIDIKENEFEKEVLDGVIRKFVQEKG